MIELKNISKSYTSLNGENIILSNVSIVLPNNGFIALCGKSGCGKTTLLNMIAGKDNDYTGDILYDDVNLKKINKIEAKKFINSNIFYLKSRDNFVKNIKVVEALYIYLSKDERNKALDLINQFKLEGLLNKKIKKLSSGELQKISIIIAVCKNAKITLLDEPICNIDEAIVEEFLSLIKELSASSLVIYISHYEDDFDGYFTHKLLLEYKKLTYTKLGENNNITSLKNCNSKYNLKKSLILEKSKPILLYTFFRLIICIILCFIIYISKLRTVRVSAIYSSSINDMSVNIVTECKNKDSDLLRKERIYYSPLDGWSDIYFNSFTYGHTHITGEGKASDFIFSNFNESLKDNEIIISDYLAYKEKAKVGDEVLISKQKFDGTKVTYKTKYIIKHVYKTNYASLISQKLDIPLEYSYIYLSDTEIDQMIDDSLNSFGGVLLNNEFYVSAYDNKFVECNYYDESGFNQGYAEPADDEFYAGNLALSKLGLGSIISDVNTYFNGSDEYYAITFTYNGLSMTKEMKYKKFVSNECDFVVNKNFFDELKTYFGINSDNVLNYKEVTILDTSNSNINSFFNDFTSFDDMTFLNDNILKDRSSNISTLNDFYKENYIYGILFFGIFLSLCIYKIIQIEYEYFKLLKEKNFNLCSRINIFLSSKILIYALLTILIIILSNFITVV